MGLFNRKKNKDQDAPVPPSELSKDTKNAPLPPLPGGDAPNPSPMGPAPGQLPEKPDDSKAEIPPPPPIAEPRKEPELARPGQKEPAQKQPVKPEPKQPLPEPAEPEFPKHPAPEHQPKKPEPQKPKEEKKKFELPDFEDDELEEIKQLKKKPEPKPKPAPKPPKKLPSLKLEPEKAPEQRFIRAENYFNSKELITGIKKRATDIHDGVEKHARAEAETDSQQESITKELNSIQEKLMLIDDSLFERKN